MRRLVVILIPLLAWGCLGCRPGAPGPQSAPTPTPQLTVPTPKEVSATRLESLLNRKGSPLALDFHPLGEAVGPYKNEYFFAKFEAVVVSAPGQHTTRGIRIDVREGEYKQHTSFLDESEVRAVSNAIPFMAQYAQSVTPGKRDYSTNLKFRTAGDFTLGVVADASGSTGAWLESGSLGGATFRLGAKDLTQVKALLDAGLAWLGTHQPSIPDAELAKIPMH